VHKIRRRILNKIVIDENGCWVWQGWRSDGYGRIDIDGRKRRVHRIAYEAWVGPIPATLMVDHTCNNRPCCNPAHLEPVTHGENMRRAAVKITHCPAGHAYSEANTRVRVRRRRGRNGRPYTSTERDCRVCARIREVMTRPVSLLVLT
jgi:hypothetical protein